MDDRETARVLLEKYRDGAMNCDPVGQIATALAAARRQGLEEALAKVSGIVTYHGDGDRWNRGHGAGVREAKDAIRALIDQTAPVTVSVPVEPSEALVTVPASDLRRVLETLDDLAPYPVLPDHACVECVAHSDIIVPGFQCSRHKLAGLLEEARKS